MTEPRRK